MKHLLEKKPTVDDFIPTSKVSGIFLICVDHVTCDITCLQRSHRAWTSCRHNLYTAQSVEENMIKSYILWRWHHLICVNFWDEERGHISKLVQVLLLYVLNLCGNYDTICTNSYMTSVVSCLPERPWNVQGHSFCKQNGVYFITREIMLMALPKTSLNWYVAVNLIDYVL